MAELPSGAVTLLFTDIEGSTRLLRQLGGSTYSVLLADHHRILRSAISAFNGIEVKTEGDSFFALFPSAADAVGCAVRAQRELHAANWPEGCEVRVRMGIHTGEVAFSDGEYVGLDIHRAARIVAAAHGGQVLLSAVTHAEVGDSLPAGTSTIDLGDHRLKDMAGPERIHQLVIRGLPEAFPAIRAQPTRLDILPPESTSFVGRERELEQVRQLLADTRLLTLTGPGGTGKTRLAQRLARDVADRFGDGVAMVSLAAISDPTLVASTIRQGLGIAEDLGHPALETLVDRLHHLDALLVLDNFEQVLPAAHVVSSLLERTDRLKIVVTSRSALKVAGEQEFAVPPLAVPDASTADAASLSTSEAVALFVQRAKAVRPDFTLDDGNARAVSEICARLDGLPLAIELAASRVKLLPPQTLLDRLANRLDLLQAGGTDRSDRHSTLRGAIDWSYHLLTDDERRLFRRLGVFVGGWRLDDAEAVVPAAGVAGIEVLDGLARLVDQSLVRQAEGQDVPRFAMLETIREYARDQLARDAETDLAAGAHADHFARLAAEAEPHLTAGREWLDRLEADHANFRAALGWLAENDIERALATCGSMWRFWHLRGHLREGSALIEVILDRSEGRPPSAARAKALLGQAGLLYWQTQYAPATKAYEQALDIARSLGDGALETEALYSLAYVRAIEGDWDAATDAYGGARELYEASGSALGANWAQMGIGMVETLRGRHAESIPIIDRVVEEFRRQNDSFGIRNATSVRERALMHLGRLDEARKDIHEYVRMSHAEGDPTGLSTALLDAASLEALKGRAERAARLVGAVERIIERSGGRAPPELINRPPPMPLVRERLDERQIENLMAEGRLWSDDEAVAYALADEEAGPAADPADPAGT